MHVSSPDELMKTVTSADGTTIAFDLFGSGPPVIMVVGAFNTRATSEPLAAALQDQFTILNYDRRGRGDSGDTPPYSVEREIEDIDALIAAAGGSSAVFGYSSGATLALRAAAHGLAISNLALYEPAIRTGLRGAAFARRLQTGNVRTYALYLLALVLGLLALVRTGALG